MGQDVVTSMLPQPDAFPSQRRRVHEIPAVRISLELQLHVYVLQHGTRVGGEGGKEIEAVVNIVIRVDQSVFTQYDGFDLVVYLQTDLGKIVGGIIILLRRCAMKVPFDGADERSRSVGIDGQPSVYVNLTTYRSGNAKECVSMVAGNAQELAQAWLSHGEVSFLDRLMEAH